MSDPEEDQVRSGTGFVLIEQILAETATDGDSTLWKILDLRMLAAIVQMTSPSDARDLARVLNAWRETRRAIESLRGVQPPEGET